MKIAMVMVQENARLSWTLADSWLSPGHTRATSHLHLSPMASVSTCAISSFPCFSATRVAVGKINDRFFSLGARNYCSC